MHSIRLFLQNLVNPEFIPTGIKVALLVGTLLFTINHGSAVLQGQMTRDRWIAALITYCVPYVVNVHGQYSSALKARQHAASLSVLVRPENTTAVSKNKSLPPIGRRL